jgi:hypothetical protein
MTSSKSWSGVTPQVFACVKDQSAREHGTKYQPADANTGTATTHVTAVGTIVLGFELNGNGGLTYTIRDKPTLVPESTIWSGIDSTIKGCQK